MTEEPKTHFSESQNQNINLEFNKKLKKRRIKLTLIFTLSAVINMSLSIFFPSEVRHMIQPQGGLSMLTLGTLL